MNYNKVKSTCRVVRIGAGVALITTGVVTGNAWFYLGVAPLVAGIVNFCPICIVSKKCDLPNN